MDAKQAQLEKKLKDLMKQAAEISSQLQSIEQGAGVPHYDQIESSAHQMGQEFSRMVQAHRAREVAATTPTKIACPDCLEPCPVEIANRQVSSGDGPLELTETVAHCRRCRRSFFPST